MAEGLGHRHQEASGDILFPASLAVTDTVTRWDAHGHSTMTPVDLPGIGEPTITVAATRGSPGHLTLASGIAQHIHVGDLAMTRAGLVGEVDDVSASTASVLLVSDRSFRIDALSDITHVPGQVNYGADGTLRFLATEPSQQSDVNRVITGTTPAVTIGFAPGGTATFVPPLTPAVAGVYPTTLTVVRIPPVR